MAFYVGELPKGVDDWIHERSRVPHDAQRMIADWTAAKKMRNRFNAGQGGKPSGRRGDSSLG